MGTSMYKQANSPKDAPEEQLVKQAKISKMVNRSKAT